MLANNGTAEASTAVKNERFNWPSDLKSERLRSQVCDAGVAGRSSRMRTVTVAWRSRVRGCLTNQQTCLGTVAGGVSHLPRHVRAGPAVRLPQLCNSFLFCSLSPFLVCLILKTSLSRSIRKMSASDFNYEYFNVTFPQEYVAHVEINRPAKLNAFIETYVFSSFLLLSNLIVSRTQSPSIPVPSYRILRAKRKISSHFIKSTPCCPLSRTPLLPPSKPKRGIQ